MLYISFKKYSGIVINNRVQGIPIIKDNTIACLILYLVYLSLLLLWLFDTTGNRAFDMARVKNDGNNNKGYTYPFIIPYSMVIKEFLYPTLVNT